jgi:cytosine/adenosine deaminase-related metal-dependent hydrolase
VAVGRERVPPAPIGPSRRLKEIDLGRVAVMPGLVNAHTHLELSWMRGRLDPVATFPQWIRQVINLRRSEGGLAEGEVARAMAGAIVEARRAGTALVGDIGNTVASVADIAASDLGGIVFREVIGFAPDDADAVVERAVREIDDARGGDRVHVSLAAHAPYSVSPRVFSALRRALERRPFAPASVHLAESSDEIEFLEKGSGAWRALLETLGAWTDDWQAPQCGPVEYLDRMGFISGRLLVVHGVHLTMGELARLGRAGATLVTCPRGNLATRAGVPPVAAFHRSGVRVAVGTDSLASVDDLNLFQEMAALRRLTTEVSAGTLLAWATENGAHALGFGADFGAIEPGRRAELLAVSLPAGPVDVEEYLVSGIVPGQIAWVDALL